MRQWQATTTENNNYLQQQTKYTYLSVAFVENVPRNEPAANQKNLSSKSKNIDVATGGTVASKEGLDWR